MKCESTQQHAACTQQHHHHHHHHQHHSYVHWCTRGCFYYKIPQTRSLRHTFNFVMLSVRVYWVELQGKGFEGARAKVRPEVVQLPRFQPSSDVNISCDKVNIYPVHLLQQPALHGTGARACRKPLCHHRCVQLRT